MEVLVANSISDVDEPHSGPRSVLRQVGLLFQSANAECLD